MSNLDNLYDAFGELLYVVAMADGLIQDEEIEALENILENHPWSSEIKWSFNYERKKSSDINEVYNKVIDICKHVGPHAEFQNMIEIMESVAYASNGIQKEEQEIIDNFRNDLTEKFKNDLEKIHS